MKQISAFAKAGDSNSIFKLLSRKFLSKSTTSASISSNNQSRFTTFAHIARKTCQFSDLAPDKSRIFNFKKTTYIIVL